jgi:uncharacterized RDD family membrane protein YckC
VVWLISSLVTNLFLEFIIFTLLWFVLRVIVVQANQGQSLGRWAMDLKIIDLRWKRLPSIVTLSKREGILAVAAFIAMIGLKINFRDLLLMFVCLVPLVADAIIILSDDENNQSFHDRLSDTMITQTRRGFSLDLKMKKLINEVKETWRKKQKK